MATTSASAARMSFAKVAASAGGEQTTNLQTRPAPAMPLRDLRVGQKATALDRSAAPTSVPSHTTVLPANDLDTHSASQGDTGNDVAKENPDTTEQKLIEAVKAMEVSSPMPSLVVNGSGSTDSRRRPFAGDMFPDDMFQRADSESELGTKPPSLDGKSITSGTTFALDEKESLRPDDSASVKAAEDDDTFSGRGSIVAGSRIGSEAAARAYRDYTSERKLLQPMLERQTHGVMTPQSGSSGPLAIDDEKSDAAIPSMGPEGFNLFYRQTPDEKLLEALETPKDRIFLLKLEQDVIEFVKDSKEPFMDLPPSNSFCRMLTHKLADYYHMTHQVDAGNVLGAVRIFRTPFCRLPPPLISISNPPTSGNTPPPTAPTMKIMRRGGDTGPSPSKATSEVGSDGKEKSQAAKEKLSREEREAAYNKARERIFGKEDKGGEDVGDSNEMSRSSSVSTKDRTGPAKRSKPKQRRDDSDSFDVRSQYTPIFHQPQVQGPTWAPTSQYAIPQHGYPLPGQAAYNNQPSQYIQSQQQQQYNPMMMQSNVIPQYSTMMPQQYPMQAQPTYASHSAPITPYSLVARSPQIPQSQWQQPVVYPSPYQPQVPMQRQTSNTVAYAYGQLPSTVNPSDPKSQHPIPGSFNRHAFNPKTQSFVPGAIGMVGPQTPSQQGSPHHGSPHHGSPHLGYNSYTPPQQYINNMGYNMARQGSNSSVPSYHASPHQTHRPLMGPGMPQPHGLPQPQINHLPNMQTNGSHLPNYGNPSTLPPKPPTGV